MTKEEHIRYWLESARHDLETAESMFQSGKYDWCLFIGHLVERAQRNLLDKVTDFNIQTRYPDYKLDFYKRCNKEYADEYFCKIKELHVWLKSLIKSKRLSAPT